MRHFLILTAAEQVTGHLREGDPAQGVGRADSGRKHVARDKDDRSPSFTKAEFVPGGTIGPVR